MDEEFMPKLITRVLISMNERLNNRNNDNNNNLQDGVKILRKKSKKTTTTTKVHFQI